MAEHALRELGAFFVRHRVEEKDIRVRPEGAPDDGSGDVTERRPVHIQVAVQTIEEAQGVRFLCPKCFEANGGPIGTHTIVCWSRSRGVPDDVRPGPGRWALVGISIDDLTLEADPPSQARSVELLSGCRWHGFVDNGRTHE